MFRTILIHDGEYLSVKDNWLYVKKDDKEVKVPIDDIYNVVIDNRAASVTIPCITALTNAGVHVIICDEKHLPMSIILPLNTHYRPYNVLKKQISMTAEFKDMLWNEVVKSKLINQARVLQFCGVEKDKVDRIYQLAEDVHEGDVGNCEAVGAKMFFRGLMGTEFLRFNDDCINAALNYGYAIIRSSVAKALAVHGFNCALGIHHINEYNPFNLADDLMEPFRPIVDLWVDKHNDDLFDELTKEQRKELVSIVNYHIKFDNKKMKVRNAIEKYISSFVSAIDCEDASKLKLPYVLNDSLFIGDDEE